MKFNKRLTHLSQHLSPGLVESRGRDDNTNNRRDAAAAALKGTEGEGRPYKAMDRGTGVAFITGVGPGTGVAIAKKFATMGYKTAMLARGADRLTSIEKELTDQGFVAKAYACDVSDRAACEAVVEQVRKDFGKPSVFVHNAVQAAGAGYDILKWTEEDLTGNFQVNMLSYVRFVKLLAPDMVEANGGAIVTTGNTSAHRGKANFGAFAATKAGQRVLAESAARHLGPKGVHVAYLTIDAAIAGTPPAQMMIKNAKVKADFFINPSAIAEECFHLTQQDRSAWTFDHWIRPFGETW